MGSFFFFLTFIPFTKWYYHLNNKKFDFNKLTDLVEYSLNTVLVAAMGWFPAFPIILIYELIEMLS